MKNEKGVLPVVLAFMIAFGVVGGVCLWHIPAHSKAKQGTAPTALNGNGGVVTKG